MARSVTRRQALKKFGVGLAGMALACFGLANRAEANQPCGGQICPKGTTCVRMRKSGMYFRVPK